MHYCDENGITHRNIVVRVLSISAHPITRKDVELLQTILNAKVKYRKDYQTDQIFDWDAVLKAFRVVDEAKWRKESIYAFLQDLCMPDIVEDYSMNAEAIEEFHN